MEIRAEGLRKTFPTPGEDLVVLDGLDLDLASGSAMAVTGPSGCGKSTLLHILGTLDRPTGGRLLLGGTDPATLSERELAAFRNEHIGFVFQDHYLLPQCSLLENVLVPTLVRRSSGNGVVERARELLARVGLSDRESHRPAELSGGERQRAAIARALVLEPGIVLCDEPTGNLDSANADRVASLLLGIVEEREATLMVATHSEDLAGRLPRRLDLRAAARTSGAGG